MTPDFTTHVLRSCPHCGGSARLVSYTVDVSGKEIDWSVECENDECSAVMSLNYGADDVDATAAAWNRRASAWIPVEERVPEDGVVVITVDEKGCVDVSRLFEGRWREMDGVSHVWTITHWQPLPTPPDREDER